MLKQAGAGRHANRRAGASRSSYAALGLLLGCSTQPATPTEDPPSQGAAGAPDLGPPPIIIEPPPSAGAPIGCGERSASSPAVTGFSSWNATEGTWEDGESGLSGGSLSYGDIATESLIVGQVDPNAADPALGLTGSVASFGGFILWMSSCLDASSYGGIAFDLSGAMPAGAELVLQVQTNANYPVDELQLRGACEFTDLTARWEQCLNPRASLPVPAAGGTLNVPWSAFAGGHPEDGVNPAELLGFQWQFECLTPETPCEIDILIDNLRFSETLESDAGLPL